MNEAVALLLVQHLFPGWLITRDARGNWWAAFSSDDLDGLLAVLSAADPDAARRAVHLLTEGG
ncbi:hypothetical protein [Actinomadura chibensis]|uniref:Uncharacterized protein n=1 Tax=Actinomadura chibensis TaxID=392828 RepID=A0A5D0NX72_9ACTN|nr:hypothetical protein [Actinomadura chibensis]TYB49240.1 hypothetical protein FXF69_09040 [Actinomadura chibensis]